ncbi:MAG: PrgI family protein [Actinomycetota bacterium]|nr:PrgI family protein [Actinomycetota bacterium]
MSAVKVPADVELEDKLAFGLTARQLALLAGSGVCAYGAYLLLTALVPAPVALAAPLLVVTCGLLLALGRYDGMSGDQLALAVGRYLHAPKQQLLAPDGLPAPLARRSPARAATLDIPVRRILRNGLVQLADGSHCLLVEARGSSFELRSQVEQTAFVDCFARFLNSRAEPVQLTVRSEPATLTAHAARLEAAADGLPRELAAAAREHAVFLRKLAHETRLLRRRIVLVLGSPQRDPELASASLTRQAAEATQILAGAEVALRPLSGEQAASLLSASLDPPGPTAGSDLEGVIHATSQTTAEAPRAT